MVEQADQTGLIVAKFGGTSVANASQLRKIVSIIDDNQLRRVIVPSAPGREHPEDTKVTDLLYLAHDLAINNQSIDGVWQNIEQRFWTIINDLGLNCDLQKHLDKARDTIIAGADNHYVASRGEALNGHIVATLLDAEYVDAAEVIRFAPGRRLDPVTYDLIRDRLTGNQRYVIPGFYGADAEGNVQTFSRGGSDVSGAIAAAALKASVYENWTDVSGLLITDPRVVPDAQTIPEITYGELRELSYMGASVLHEEAVFPVRKHHIPINIRNTNRPQDLGTRIVSDRNPGPNLITGIAGRSGFTVFFIEKALMNREIGFGRRVLDVFERLGISYEHCPSGIDTLSVVVSDDQLGDQQQQVIEDLYSAVHADKISVYGNMAMIATVGMGMNRQVGTAAKLFTALAESGVNIRMIDQGSSEQNIIIGVKDEDLSSAIKAIYGAFVA